VAEKHPAIGDESKSSLAAPIDPEGKTPLSDLGGGKLVQLALAKTNVASAAL